MTKKDRRVDRQTEAYTAFCQSDRMLVRQTENPNDKKLALVFNISIFFLLQAFLRGRSKSFQDGTYFEGSYKKFTIEHCTYTCQVLPSSSSHFSVIVKRNSLFSNSSKECWNVAELENKCIVQPGRI